MKPLQPPPGRGPLPERPLVLYVEDEQENWDVTELRLQKKYRLIRAANDQQACSAVRQHGNALFAVLMDIQLSGSTLDGIQLTRLFRGKLDATSLPAYARACPLLDVPIFFVTAYGDRYSEAELIQHGGSGLVHKPVDFVNLTLRLATVNAQRAVTTLERGF